MGNVLTYGDLEKILPHAYPFLLIDKVEDYRVHEWLMAVKNVTGNEWQQERESSLSQHFPETLLIEAAAQAALVLYHVSKVCAGQRRPKYFLGRSKAEFNREVRVGETLNIRVSSGKLMDSGGYADARLSVGQFNVAQMELIFKVIQQ